MRQGPRREGGKIVDITKGAEIVEERGREAELHAEYVESVIRENLAAINLLLESYEKNPLLAQDPEFIAKLYLLRAEHEKELALAQGARKVGRDEREAFQARRKALEKYAQEKEANSKNP